MPQQDIGERYYYADGRKIPLVPSHTFIAVKADSADAARAAETRVASILSTLHAPTQVFDLPEHNLRVIRVPNGIADASSPVHAAQADRVRALMDEEPGLQRGRRSTRRPTIRSARRSSPSTRSSSNSRRTSPRRRAANC